MRTIGSRMISDPSARIMFRDRSAPRSNWPGRRNSDALELSGEPPACPPESSLTYRGRPRGHRIGSRATEVDNRGSYSSVWSLILPLVESDDAPFSLEASSVPDTGSEVNVFFCNGLQPTSVILDLQTGAPVPQKEALIRQSIQHLAPISNCGDLSAIPRGRRGVTGPAQSPTSPMMISALARAPSPSAMFLIRRYFPSLFGISNESPGRTPRSSSVRPGAESSGPDR